MRNELASLAKSYGSFRFEAVDNIMDMKYFNDLLPTFQAEGLDYEFFYEVKSNLTREKVRALRDSGVVRIQPGIQSFSAEFSSSCARVSPACTTWPAPVVAHYGISGLEHHLGISW